MNSFISSSTAITIFAAATLCGCANQLASNGKPGAVRTVGAGAAAATAGHAASPDAAPVIAASSADQVALKEGITLYENGAYHDAIKHLGSASEIWVSGPKSSQLMALKYMAFSYCLTNRQTLCLKQFEKALKLDPAFDLAPGENGHPLWGPVFARAKKAK